MEEHKSVSEQPPPLYLEDLRKILKVNVARQLAFDSGEWHDSEME